MPCKSCGSDNQKRFSAEMSIHFPGLQNIEKPVVWVFPEVLVCLDCGTAEFDVPEAELRQLCGPLCDVKIAALPASPDGSQSPD
jgi:hypothetical protein